MTSRCTSSQRALFTAADGELSLDAPSLPPSQHGEFFVAVEMCTICGSDLHTLEGRRSVSGPTVLGHEIIGRVQSLPSLASCVDIAGQAVSVGDRVSWTIHASCGECFWCRHHLAQKCEHLFKYGHSSVTDSLPLTGGFATHCQILPGTQVIRLDDRLDARVACPANCATATVAASFRQSVVPCEGACVLVLGAGMLGLTATAWAREHGAAQIVVVDPHEQRAKRAYDFGASVVCLDLATAEAEVRTATDGRGADVSLELSGNNQAVLAAIHFLRMGGQALLVGSVFPCESISISPEQLVRRCGHVTGIHNYLAEDLLAAVRFLERAQGYPFAELISATYPLADINQAVARAKSREDIRVAVVPK